MKRISKFMISMLLIAVIVLSSMFSSRIVKAEPVQLEVTEMYDYAEIAKTYLADEEAATAQYPNGAFMMPVSAMELQMNGFYSYVIFRQGGIEEEASVTVKTNDLTACYGIDYEIYLSDYSDAEPVEGKANPYYNMMHYSFIPTVTQTGTIIDGNSSYTTDELNALRSDISEYNDAVNELMPVSSEFTLNFEAGERFKTIYIKTLECDTVRADLEFTINLCKPENASIGSDISTAVTIKEYRKMPNTVVGVADVVVNPESEVAYAVIKRFGNYGTFGTVTIRTKSGTAKAGEAYEATQLNLDFTPGMSEIKVPIEMLDGAVDGTQFEIEISDSENVKVARTLATAYITNETEEELRHQTAADSLLTASMVTRNTKERNQYIIDLNKFSETLHTERGKVKKSGIYYSTNNNDGENAYCEIKYNNYWSSKNNGIEVRSNEKIDFTGVDSITWRLKNLGGSTNISRIGFYVSDNGKLTSKMSDYDWFEDDLGGIGGSSHMANISDEKVYTYSLDQSKVSGEHYLYIMLHHGALVGTAGSKLYNNTGSSTHNMHLNLTKYNVQVIAPDNQNFFTNGTLTDMQIVDSQLLSDPAATSSSTVTYMNKIDMYRDETTAIKYSTIKDYNGYLKLKGVVFCKDAKGKDPSSLWALDSGSFTLTGEVLRTYSDYIITDNGGNKNIYIKPVYEIAESKMDVVTYGTSSSAHRFVLDENEAGKGHFYYNNVLVGTLTWDVRDNGKYYVCDKVTFNFEYADTYDVNDGEWRITYDTRMAGSKERLQVADKVTVDTGTFKYECMLEEIFASIKPIFTKEDTAPSLLILNPDNGDFVGKNDKLYQVENDDDSIVLKGYIHNDIDTDFSKVALGQIITFYANPNESYRAKWQYTDAVTGEVKTYYGDTFFYARQNVGNALGNRVTLEYEEINTSMQYSTYVYGQTLLQRGSILSPAFSTTDTNDVEAVNGASVTIGTRMGISDSDGEYHLETKPTQEDSQMAAIMVMKDEIHRVLVSYNNQYYLSEIDFSKAETKVENNETYTKADLILPYKTYGVIPTGISARNSKGEVYGDTITLVKTSSVTFDLAFSDKGAIEGKPVNMVKWTLESDNSVDFSEEIVLSKGVTICQFTQVLSEVARPGQKLYVELFNIKYDDNANAEYHSYGKFDTGYSFIATSVEETITYAPDIGVPAKMSQPIPCIGGVSPNFSVYGFTPIINTGTTGRKYDGHDLKTVSLGMSFSLLSDVAAEDKSLKSFSPLDVAKGLGKKLDALDEALNSGKGLPAFANGLKRGNALNMQTAVKLSFSVTVCYQGNYYVDDTGEWKFVGNMLVVGAGGTIKISIPFVLFYVPCFVNFVVSVNANIYMGIFPETDGTGEQVALTLNQLSDAGMCRFQGVYQLKIALSASLGIGYDGIISASGNINCNFDIQFNDFLRGYGDVVMSGGVTLELLFIKYQWKESIFAAQLFNTLDTNDTVNRALRGSFQKDIMNTVTLDEMTLNLSENNEDNTESMLRSISRNRFTHETKSLVDSKIIEISDGVYFVTVVKDVEEALTTKNNVLHYFIYDSNTNTVTNFNSVLHQAYEDNYGLIDDEKLQLLTENLYRFDGYTDIVDCGDDILIVWNKLSTLVDENTTKLDVLKATGIASIYYNKATGKFHDFNFTRNDDRNKIFIAPKAVYNEQTDTAHAFFTSIDLSTITGQSTLEDIHNLPVSLFTMAVSPSGSNEWSVPVKINTTEKTIKYYDAIENGDSVSVAYVAADSDGYVLDDISQYENDFDEETLKSFNTVNKLYMQDIKYDTTNDEIVIEERVQITGDEYVSANPTFVWAEYNNDRNLLLFYKCNGKYAYQNISAVMAQGVYTDENGIKRIEDGFEVPDFITDEYDYSVNDDIQLYHKDNNILFIWTSAEGGQQQLWAKNFTITGTEESVDREGRVFTFLKGEWGHKTYLTEGGADSTGTKGFIKKDFDACMISNNELLAVYNAFDYDYLSESEDIKKINNMFVVDVLDISPKYEIPETDQIMFSNDYPENGETITVSMQAKNIGVLPGENVKVKLYVNGTEYSSQSIDRWTTDDKYRIFTVDYTLPEGVRADEVSMYFTVSDEDNVYVSSDRTSLKYDYSLKIRDINTVAVKKFTDDCKKAVYKVDVTIENVGNVDYNGGLYFRFIEQDMNEMSSAMSPDYEGNAPIYTCYGSMEITPIESGDIVKITMISDEIDESVFDKYAGKVTAYFMGIIGDEVEWKTAAADDIINIESQYYEGLTVKPVPVSIKTLSADDITIVAGNGTKIVKNVTPLIAAVDNDFTYKSLNPDVATVSPFGYVTGLKSGTAIIEVSSGDITTQLTIKVLADSNSGDVDAMDGVNTDYLRIILVVSLAVAIIIMTEKKRKMI